MDDRVRQFHAVAQMLRLACQQVPLVIVLEDAHWADEASLLLLGYIVRGLTDERLLIMASARAMSNIALASNYPACSAIRPPQSSS